MQLKVRYRFVDETGEWRVIGTPYTTLGGKTAHVRVELVAEPGVTEVRSWGAHERISVTRADRSGESSKRLRKRTDPQREAQKPRDQETHPLPLSVSVQPGVFWNLLIVNRRCGGIDLATIRPRKLRRCRIGGGKAMMLEQTLFQKLVGAAFLFAVVGLSVLMPDWSDIKKRLLKKKSGRRDSVPR